MFEFETLTTPKFEGSLKKIKYKTARFIRFVLWLLSIIDSLASKNENYIESIVVE